MRRIIILILTALLTYAVYPQRGIPGGLSRDELKAIKVTPAQRTEILSSLQNHIKENYILQENVPRILKEFKQRIDSGSFDDKADALSLSIAITKDLREITNDYHFGVMYNPSMFKMIESMRAGGNGTGGGTRVVRNGSGGQGSGGPRRVLRRGGGLPGDASKRNYYFTKLEILEGNVGYLKIEMMPGLEEAKPTVDAAMRFLQNSDALIIDLRNNPGGVGGFIPYLMSYFFSEGGKHLYSRKLIFQEEMQKLYTEKTLKQKKLDKIPLYILINERTGSAAANLTYTLQKHDRAKVVGVPSQKGYMGANSASPFPLKDNFVAIVPVGTVVHAKTGTNWNMTGIDPDIPAKEKPLEAARSDAIKKIGYKKPKSGRRMRAPGVSK